MSQQQERPDTDLLAEQASAQAKEAIKQVNELREVVHDLENKLEAEQEERLRLQAELKSLREDTELVSEMKQDAVNKKDQRAMVLVQTLYRRAGENGKARMTIKDAMNTLQGTVERTQLYPTFQRAVDLVGDEDVLEYVQKPRGAEIPSHLLMDRNAGTVPIECQPRPEVEV